MEANEVQELHEQHEHAAGEGHPGHTGGMKPVSFTMSVLAVLVAIVTVLGHRTHTEAVLMQARASDQWNFYQAKKIRQNDTELAADILSATSAPKSPTAVQTLAGYRAHLAKWKTDTADEQETACGFEERVEKAERQAGRFDMSEALLEIALVVTSITLLTRLRAYWFVGMAFGAVGIIVALAGLALG